MQQKKEKRQKKLDIIVWINTFENYTGLKSIFRKYKIPSKVKLNTKIKTLIARDIFNYCHHENLKSTYDMIGDWIVESGTNLGDKPMFEKYLNRDPRRTKPENLKTEIYVPIS